MLPAIVEPGSSSSKPAAGNIKRSSRFTLPQDLPLIAPSKKPSRLPKKPIRSGTPAAYDGILNTFLEKVDSYLESKQSAERRSECKEKLDEIEHLLSLDWWSADSVEKKAATPRLTHFSLEIDSEERSKRQREKEPPKEKSFSEKLEEEYSEACLRVRTPVISIVSLAIESSVTILDLGSYGLSRDALSALLSVLPRMILRELDISNNGIDAEGTQAIAVAVKASTTIVSLNLNLNPITGEGAKFLLDLLDQSQDPSPPPRPLSPPLDDKDLDSVPLSDPPPSHTLRLESLSLSNTKLSDDSISVIATALGLNTSLRALDISRNKSGPTCGNVVGTLLSRNSRLLNLNLNWNVMRKNAIVGLTEGLSMNRTLSKLDLAWTGFGDLDSISKLCAALKVGSSITSLDLSHNRVTDSAAFVLADYLHSTTHIRSLDFSGNPVSAGAGRALVLACSRSPNQTLKVYGCGFENATVGSKASETSNFDDATPAGPYSLRLESPYHIAILRRLYEMTDGLQGSFDIPSVRLNDLAYSLPPTLAGLPTNGRLSFNFSLSALPPTFLNHTPENTIKLSSELFTECTSDRATLSGLCRVLCAGSFFYSFDQLSRLLPTIPCGEPRALFAAAVVHRIVPTERLVLPPKDPYGPEEEADPVEMNQYDFNGKLDPFYRDRLMSFLRSSEKRLMIQFQTDASAYFHHGNATGHYKLNLASPIDRDILIRLIEKRNAFLTANTDRLDSAIDFAMINTELNRKPWPLSPSTQLPTSGYLDVDFIEHREEGSDGNIFCEDLAPVLNSKIALDEISKLKSIRTLLCSYDFTVAQAEQCLAIFPSSSPRVDFLLSLFSRLSDFHGFRPMLFERLSHTEQALFTHRLGWHNLWDPVCATGHYFLRLDSPYDRHVAAEIATDFKDNLVDCEVDGESVIVGAEWRDQIPTSGTFSCYITRSEEKTLDAFSHCDPSSLPSTISMYQPFGLAWTRILKRYFIMNEIYSKFASADEFFSQADRDSKGFVAASEIKRCLADVKMAINDPNLAFIFNDWVQDEHSLSLERLQCIWEDSPPKPLIFESTE